MSVAKLKAQYLPMSETAYYILLSLTENRHGYGIMQHVESLTSCRLKIGAGTLYGSLSRMEKDGLILSLGEEDRRKTYAITELGKKLLQYEISRLQELLDNGLKHGGINDESKD